MKDFQFFKLRLPASLHERVSASAAQTGHSINTETVLRLEASFSRDRFDELIRDPELRYLGRLMLETFVQTARIVAESREQPDLPTSEWFGDRELKFQAVQAIAAVLLGPMSAEELETLVSLHRGQRL